jgi:CheY-like chemotaxis protein
MSARDRLPSRRVLVVDDSPFTSGFLVALLEKEGHAVQVVGDGKQAQLRLHWWRPDVILLDLNMPIMDGWEFLRQRQEDEVARSIPVVVLSSTDEGLFAAARELGADLCLKKPFRAADVLDALARIHRFAKR